jgi:hypothetical protein
MRASPIYLDGNDDEPEETLTRKVAATGATEAATGLTGLTFKLSATRNGAAINAALSKSASERGTLGIYYATFEGADLTAQLGTYVGKDIYQTFGDGANVNFTVARRVIGVRP